MSTVQNPSTPTGAEAPAAPQAHVEITGCNVEVPEHFQERVNAKLAKIERLDTTLTSFHVELTHERNPRRADEADRIQVTATGKGHIARAEAKEENFYAALESVMAKMERSLRKVKARRSISRSGHRAPISVGEATAGLVEEGLRSPEGEAGSGSGAAGTGAAAGETSPGPFDVDPYAEQFEPGRVVRRKEHAAIPMSVDDALSRMELVGHDFFLFVNEETGRPSVVYRRHAYDYGLIALTEPDAADAADAAGAAETAEAAG
ncbi:ribosome hibernation-promoting factor, HPF/YfiA family [Corynebacterium bovis]|uniref:ribosome hibernation-promoting factor, HPF/YfiA family n=1 Tax=Corynebacterium bovis TaxID=36808 RepID=UPI003138F02A